MATEGTEPDPDSTAIRAAHISGEPYLVYADGHGRARVKPLSRDWHAITIGRGMAADIALTWDEEVSRIHAQLEQLAEEWVIVDDGLSANGTFVNGERVERRRRLFDGDEIGIGVTRLVFHAPSQFGPVTAVHPVEPGDG